MLEVKRSSIAVNGTPSHSYGMSLATWDPTVLPATRHKRTCPALTPAMQAGTRFTYPGGMEGWVDLVDLIAPQPEVDHWTFDHESDAEPLHHQDKCCWDRKTASLVKKEAIFVCSMQCMIGQNVKTTLMRSLSAS